MAISPNFKTMNNKNGLSKQPKVALVHDFLNQYGGGERVIEQLAEIWPDANIYTSLYDKKIMESWLKIDPSRIKTNFISRLPFANYLSKHYFFLYPLAFRMQNLGDADIIISTSSYAAKFARGKKGSIHICYLHTVPRFLWGYDTELSGYYRRPFDRILAPIYKLVVPIAKFFLKKADFLAAQKIDYFIVNSNEVKKRLAKHYKRDGEVIYPPVDVERFAKVSSTKSQETREDYYLVVSRLSAYKKIDIAVHAFNKLGKRLIIVGDGPQMAYLKSIAAPNVELLGRIADEKVTQLVNNCKAFVFPAFEDFGIVVVEAQAAGKPVIAYGEGGATETVIDGQTGLFFREQSVKSIIEAVKKFETRKFDPKECQKQAEKFSKEVFKKNILDFVSKVTQKEIT